MKIEDVEFYLMEKVRTPNGPGVLAGKRFGDDGQMQVLVRHLVAHLTCEIPVEVPLNVRHGRKWVFYTYPPEVVEIVEP